MLKILLVKELRNDRDNTPKLTPQKSQLESIGVELSIHTHIAGGCMESSRHCCVRNNTNGKDRQKQHFFHKVVCLLYTLSSVACFHLSHCESEWWYSCDCDDEKFHFATVLQHENPSSSELNANHHANNKWSTLQDQIHSCRCMSLPTASQNIQYYLKAGCGLACAVVNLQHGSKMKERPTQKFIPIAR
jgi:hypothetical protein